jgi:hypothetical protein
MAARSQIGWSEQRQDLYRFYLDVAAQAYELHEKWRTHQGVSGYIRSSARVVESSRCQMALSSQFWRHYLPSR